MMNNHSATLINIRVDVRKRCFGCWDLEQNEVPIRDQSEDSQDQVLIHLNWYHLIVQ